MPHGLSQNFLDRLKERIKRYWSGGDSGEEEAHIDHQLIGPVSGLAQVMHRIRVAGRERVLLYMKYNNSWRHVEPYSFRMRSKGVQPLFYGWCLLHDEIHSFRVDRIQDIHVTDRPFMPRDTVEIG